MDAIDFYRHNDFYKDFNNYKNYYEDAKKSNTANIPHQTSKFAPAKNTTSTAGNAQSSGQ